VKAEAEELIRSLLALDLDVPEQARELVQRRGEVRLLIDLLALEGRVPEACELGLALEEALEQAGEPAEAGGRRAALLEGLLAIARAGGHTYYIEEVLTRQAEIRGRS
jgi:hypothetical protein